MKKLFILALALTLALAPVRFAFAEEFDLEPIYDVYGFGEQIFICGNAPAGVPAALITIVESATGSLKYNVSFMASDLREGIYINVESGWALGMYELYVSFSEENVSSFTFEVQEKRADHGGSSGGGSKQDVTATGVSISQSELLLHLGETATVTASGDRSSFKWTTDDADKIIIAGANTAEATITPKRTGTATVWVYCGNNYATLNITIVPAEKKEPEKEPEKKPENEPEKEPDKQPENEPEKDADSFADLASAPWAREAINALAAGGIVSGMGGGIFAPADGVTRAQFVQMTVKAFGFSGKEGVSFTDVSDGDWFADAVLTAAANGVVNGYDGRFEPASPVTCRDAAVILHRVLKMKGAAVPEAAASADDYSAEAVGSLTAAGVITGEMSFSPLEGASRAQSAYMIYGALNLVK